MELRDISRRLLLSKQLPERQLKTRKDFAAIENPGACEHTNVQGVIVNLDFSRIRIDDPDELDACLEILVDFAKNLV